MEASDDTEQVEADAVSERVEKRICKGIAFVLLCVFFALALSSARVKSSTVDEGDQLLLGYSYLRTFRLRFQRDFGHPRLSATWASLPLLLDRRISPPSEITGWEDPKDFGKYIFHFYHSSPNVMYYTFLGRVQSTLLGVLLGALVFRCARDWFGCGSGLLACFLYAFSPNTLAHSRLITNDIPAALACLTTMYVLWHFLRRAGILRAVLMGLVLGGALLVKYSTVLLVPTIGILLLLATLHRDWRWSLWPNLTRGKAVVRSIGLAVLVFGLAGLVVWAGFDFEVGPLESINLPFPLPATRFLDGIIYRAQEKRPAFLLGLRWVGGRWYYFPATLLFKMPPLILMLLLITFVTAVLKRRLEGQLPLWLFPAVYFPVSLTAGFNIGYRHLLPMLPFGYVFASQVTRLLPGCMGARLGRTCAWLLKVLSILWYLGASLGMYPDYLAYFNVFAGGPSKGYRVLVDSNLDWGQDLIQLKQYMDLRNIDEVWLSQFGRVEPALYGVRYRQLPSWIKPESRPGFHRFHPAPGVYVIGATPLQGMYLPDRSTFDWFLRQDPDDQIGHSMLVYDVEEGPLERKWVGVCGDPDPPLSTDEVLAGFGIPDLRVLYFRCRSSGVIPGEGGAGWYIVPASAENVGSPLAEWLEGADVEFTQYDGEGNLSFTVYGLESAPGVSIETDSPVGIVRGDATPGVGANAAARFSLPVELEGPAEFLGYGLGAKSVSSGEVLTVSTVWRANRVVTTTVPSVFAHLVDVSGDAWSIGDALSFSAIQWQEGDVFVQRHTLELPADVPAGTYWVASGLYDLATGDRYPVRATQAGLDTFLLGPVVVKDDF